MKLYADENLTQEIVDSFSFGIVPVGDTKRVKIWVKNDDNPNVTGYLKNLEFKVTCLDPQLDTVITDEEVKVLEAPQNLSYFAVEPIVLEWTPNVNLEQGLKARLTVTGQKIVG
jgi:hypothetical protein